MLRERERETDRQRKRETERLSACLVLTVMGLHAVRKLDKGRVFLVVHDLNAIDRPIDTCLKNEDNDASQAAMIKVQWKTLKDKRIQCNL